MLYTKHTNNVQHVFIVVASECGITYRVTFVCVVQAFPDHQASARHHPPGARVRAAFGPMTLRRRPRSARVGAWGDGATGHKQLIHDGTRRVNTSASLQRGTATLSVTVLSVALLAIAFRADDTAAVSCSVWSGALANTTADLGFSVEACKHDRSFCYFNVKACKHDRAVLFQQPFSRPCSRAPWRLSRPAKPRGP